MGVMDFLTGGVLDTVNTGLQAGAQVLNQINQRKVWQREDTAVQRRVADLKAAGLSPTLAAGSAASTSAPIRVEAPQYRSDVAAQSAGIAQTRAQRVLTDVQSGLAKEQIENARWKRDLEWMQSWDLRNKLQFLSDADKSGASYSSDLARSQVERQIAENQDATRNLSIYRTYGVPTGSSAAAEQIANLQMLKQLFPNLDTSKVAGFSVLSRALIPLLGEFAGRLP